jgi:hypothetical protein
MQTSDWDHLETTSEEDEQPKGSEDDMDRLGVKISLLVLCVALFFRGLLDDKHRKFPEV